MRKLILSILAMLSLMVSTACGQAGKDRLTAKTLQKATRIQYYTDNGTVAPDHHFGVTVTVSRDSVCLTVTKGYKQQVIYSQTAPLTPAHYEQFIKQLAELSIHNTSTKAAPTSGGGAESIEVADDNGVLFQGNVNKAMAYDFSAVCSTGQTLYYTITSDIEPYTVSVATENEEYPFYNTTPTGDLEIPESVEFNSITYSVTGLIDYALQHCNGFGVGAIYLCTLENLE